MLSVFETVYVDETMAAHVGAVGPIYDKPYVRGARTARHQLGTYQVGMLSPTGVAYLFIRFSSGERCVAWVDTQHPGPIEAWLWEGQ